MNNDLYFIPIIAKALDAPEKERALDEAFAKIELLGQEAKCQEGFKQFQRLMNVVDDKTVGQDVQSLLADIMESLFIELATGILDDSQEKESALTKVNSRAEWRERYEMLCVELEDSSNRPYSIEMNWEEQGKVVETVSFEAAQRAASISNITPGSYSLRLSTGRLLWKGELTDNDLIWSHAFPGRALDLAADTGEASQEASLEISLLDGEVLTHIYPGIENGCMEIVLQSSRGQWNV